MGDPSNTLIGHYPIVQALDGVIGELAHDPSKTYGPFAFAVLNALAGAWLMRGQESHPDKITTS